MHAHMFECWKTHQRCNGPLLCIYESDLEHNWFWSSMLLISETSQFWPHVNFMAIWYHTYHHFEICARDTRVGFACHYIYIHAYVYQHSLTPHFSCTYHSCKAIKSWSGNSINFSTFPLKILWFAFWLQAGVNLKSWEPMILSF